MNNIWVREEYEYGKGLIERIKIKNVPIGEDLKRYNSNFNNLIIHKKAQQESLYDFEIDFDKYINEYIQFKLE